jgi:glycerol-3-phosphate cytidylyltransferase-like family protein
MAEHDIDMVVHGHTPEEDAEIRAAWYAEPAALGRFSRLDRTPGISTTDLITRIVRRSKDGTLPC